MAGTYKTFLENDRATVTQDLYEVVPITASIVTGSVYDDDNIKNYSHGIWQAVYDYPYLSSSANLMFSLSGFYSNNSSLSSSANTQNAKKINLYNTLAKTHMGTDVTGNILRFDQDGNIADGGGKIDEGFVMAFSRLLYKDEIKKGSFRLDIYTGGTGSRGGAIDNTTVGDYGAEDAYKTNSPVGDYGVLYTSSATPNSGSGYGLIFYKTGVVVLSGSLFSGPNSFDGFYVDGATATSGSFSDILTGSTMQQMADGIRNRLNNIQFQNTTNIHSTVYFCRFENGDMNYSSNPTYVSSSRFVTKNKARDLPVTYVTTIGLYNANNELMAVGKLSEPIKKRADSELVIRVRTDF